MTESLDDVERQVDNALLRKALSNALDSLTPQQRLVITLRFGLDDNSPLFLRQIGEQIGLGAERIRAIEAKALRLLRHPKRSRPLRAWLE